MKPQSVNKLIKLLKPKNIIHIPKDQGKYHFPNIYKSKRSNWKPKISFEDGVEKILENIDYWKDAPLWNKNIKLATKSWFKYMQ